MKYLLLLVPFLLVFACVPNQQVAEVPSTVGYYSYGPLMQKVTEARKAECDKSEECKEPAPLTEQDVLAVITQSKRYLESNGMSVIGIEAEKARIWFSKPVEPHIAAE